MTWGSQMRGFGHLGLQRRAPTPAAPCAVTRDQSVVDFDHMRLVAHVRFAVLLPCEHELDELTVGDGGAADLLETSRVGEPAAELSLDVCGAADGVPPV